MITNNIPNNGLCPCGYPYDNEGICTCPNCPNKLTYDMGFRSIPLIPSLPTLPFIQFNNE